MKEKITFEPLLEEHLELLHQWFQIPHVKEWYARGESFTHEMIVDKYLPRIKDQASILNFIICVNGKPIGYIQLYCLSHYLPEGVSDRNHPLFEKYKPNELAGIDIFIADEQYLGTGIGSSALSEFINTYIKGKFKAVVSDPVKQNVRAIIFFEKNGFVKIDDHHDSYHLLMLYKIECLHE
tara:strand:+ start:689 stop:1231 length:543 start_codon:yes stop_codon:yes gene_type:complete